MNPNVPFVSTWNFVLKLINCTCLLLVIASRKRSNLVTLRPLDCFKTSLLAKTVWVVTIILSIAFVIFSKTANAHSSYGQSICSDAAYYCLTIKRGDSWVSLFPDAVKRDIVKRVNRMNVLLKPHMVIAVPQKLEQVTVFDVSPFPKYIVSRGERLIKINKKTQAWAAYDESGQLVWWGPISSGVAYCHDIHGVCETPTGEFRLIRKKGLNCLSKSFPNYLDGSHGGAIMPFCMFFHAGYALHGSYDLAGYPSSHGCVLLFVEDAKWLNEEFASVSKEGKRGTLVLIN